jgi:hypothetical protein
MQLDARCLTIVLRKCLQMNIGGGTSRSGSSPETVNIRSNRVSRSTSDTEETAYDERSPDSFEGSSQRQVITAKEGFAPACFRVVKSCQPLVLMPRIDSTMSIMIPV